MLQRRTFLGSALVTAAATSLSGTALGAIRRFAPPRPARNAEHGIVYRNEGEFCA